MTKLRKFSLKDAKEYKRIIDNKEITWYGKYLRDPYPLAKVKDYIRNQLKIKNYIELSILEGNVLVGTLSIEKIDEVKGRANIGYWIAKSYRNKGIATRAVRIAVGYVFKKLKLGKIYAEVGKDNISSIKVLEKAGFTKECKRVDIKNKRVKYIYSIKTDK